MTRDGSRWRGGTWDGGCPARRTSDFHAEPTSQVRPRVPGNYSTVDGGWLVEKKFNSDEVPLGQLLQQAQSGELQLPDFQRGWVWDDNHIASLLASISVSYPIGAVMTLRTGNPDVRFRPRPLEGVELGNTVEPDLMLLDGQQRTTSLYLALKSGKPVPTTDSRGKDLQRRYYIDIREALRADGDREEAIVSVPPDGRVKNFRGEVRLDVSDREAEIAAEMFPLDIVMDQPATMDWQLAYLDHGPGEQSERLKTWMRFNESVINPFVQYQVPVIQLAKSTPKEAVCQVFEKVNTGGVSLTVFELITATYAADDFNLRDDWNARRAAFREHPVLARFEPSDFLQVVTLLTTYERRVAHLAANPDLEKAPAVSCKRRDVLRLSLEDYRKWADVATEALLRAVPFVHGEHVFTARDLPYATQLVPLTAIFATLGDRANGHGVRQKLRRWYWSGVFGEMYGGSTETRFANDLLDVVAWITSDGSEPRTVREAQFQADRLLTLRSRNSAAYKGLYALQMKRGGRDFRTGNPIDVHAYFDDAIDIHHVFPQKWCSDNSIARGIADSVVNKTAIDAHTNRRVGGAAPSQYLQRIESQEEIDPAELDAILRSHDIDPIALRQDDFAGFFNHRFERLLKQIEEAMGKPVNRSADRTESPFAVPERREELQRQRLDTLIAGGESKVVEFKSTGRKNLHTGDKDPAMEWAIVKTIAGFMNGHGGTLVVGVDDDGRAIGLEQDYPHLKKPDRDGWELWLTDLLTTCLGKAAAAEVEVSITDHDGVDVARLDVGPAVAPVFAVPLKGEKHERFLVRINNSTQELVGSEALAYQQRRWPG